VFWQVLPRQTAHGFYNLNEPSRIAWAMLSGHGFSSPWPLTPLAATAQQPPVYPALLACIFHFLGPYTYGSLYTAVFFNAVFEGLTGILILYIGKQMLGPWAGVLAAWVWACWMYEAVVSMRLWESSLSALLLMVSLWLLLKLDGASSPLRWALFGILAGIAGLTNTVLLSVFVGFWLWLLVRNPGWQYFRKVLIAVLFCIFTLTPWTVRNYQQFHRLIPVRDNFGLELWIGTRDEVSIDVLDYKGRGEIAFMDEKRKEALEFIRSHPDKFLLRGCYKFFRFWTDPGALWLPVSALAWLGCIYAVRKRGADAAPFAVVLLTFPDVYYITHPGASYRHPIEPVLLLLAAFLVVTTLQALYYRRSNGPIGRSDNERSEGENHRSPQAPKPGGHGNIAVTLDCREFPCLEPKLL
jgi:hypothetical protein